MLTALDTSLMEVYTTKIINQTLTGYQIRLEGICQPASFVSEWGGVLVRVKAPGIQIAVY
jgi:hypothetical protein